MMPEMQEKIESKPKIVCVWFRDDVDYHYETTCENAFGFVEGNVSDNGFWYCPYCGESIEETTHSETGYKVEGPE